MPEWQIGENMYVNDMELERIARILYNMSLGMDYAEFLDYAEEEIACITKELQLLKDNECDSTLQALENIASANKNMEFWKENMEEKSQKEKTVMDTIHSTISEELKRLEGEKIHLKKLHKRIMGGIDKKTVKTLCENESFCEAFRRWYKAEFGKKKIEDFNEKIIFHAINNTLNTIIGWSIYNNSFDKKVLIDSKFINEIESWFEQFEEEDIFEVC